MVSPQRISPSVSRLSLATIALGLAMLPLTACRDDVAHSESPVPASGITATPAKMTESPAPDASLARPARSPETAQPDSRPLLICFGDSLTAGYGTDPGQSYPDDLQHLLDKQGYRYRVVNEGVSGNTTKDGLDRIDSVIEQHPRLVVVEFGGNDGLRGLPVEQTKANLSEIIDRIQKSGATVALAGITLPPDYGADYIGRFDAMYPALAKQYHVRLLPFLLQNVYGVPGDMQDDATHATAKGNKQVAENVQQLIHPLLKK
jgi:acyl-CoA thioesterase-1